jgi:hypothetical protein
MDGYPRDGRAPRSCARRPLSGRLLRSGACSLIRFPHRDLRGMSSTPHPRSTGTCVRMQHGRLGRILLESVKSAPKMLLCGSHRSGRVCCQALLITVTRRQASPQLAKLPAVGHTQDATERRVIGLIQIYIRKDGVQGTAKGEFDRRRSRTRWRQSASVPGGQNCAGNPARYG